MLTKPQKTHVTHSWVGQILGSCTNVSRAPKPLGIGYTSHDHFSDFHFAYLYFSLKPWEVELWEVVIRSGYNPFRHKRGLQVHQNACTREKVFKCDICNYASKWKTALTRHIRIHTGEKPYKCQLCNYSSNNSSDLRRHVQTHTGEKLHKCGECGSAFSRRHILEDHILRKHRHRSKKSIASF